MPRSWTSQLFISCALPRALGQTFSWKEHVVLPWSWGVNPKKDYRAAHLFGSSTYLPHQQGLSCDCVWLRGCRNQGSILQPTLCVGQSQPLPVFCKSLIIHLVVLQSTQNSPHTSSFSHSHVFVCRHLLFSGWGCHYYYFLAIFLFLQLSSLCLATHKGLFVLLTPGIAFTMFENQSVNGTSFCPKFCPQDRSQFVLPTHQPSLEQGFCQVVLNAFTQQLFVFPALYSQSKPNYNCATTLIRSWIRNAVYSYSYLVFAYIIKVKMEYLSYCSFASSSLGSSAVLCLIWYSVLVSAQLNSGFRENLLCKK